MRGRGSNFNAISLEEGTDVALDKTFVEIAANTLGKATGIDEEPPESINDTSARGVGQTIGPSMPSGKVYNDETVGEATRTFAVAVSNIHADGVKFMAWAFKKLAFIPTL
jgi:hypothetical protein